MRVGCGVFGSWYGYSGGGAEVDQIWIEKATGRVLREEGYYGTRPAWTANYHGIERTADDGQVPREIVVRLLSNGPQQTWVFRMHFQLLQGKTWLLQDLTEFQGEEKDAVIATVSNASTSAPEPAGPVEKADGNSSIRYKYRAKIWDKETKIINQVFTFDPKGRFVSVKDADAASK